MASSKKIKEELEAEKARMRQQEADKFAAQQAQAAASGEKDVKKKTTDFELDDVGQKSWNAIINAYKKKYENEPDYEDPGEKGVLKFPTPEAAMEFFTKQAEEKHEFLATRLENGQLQNDHMFSFGNGHLYKGSLGQIRKEIEALDDSEQRKIGLAKLDAMSKTLPESAKVEKVDKEMAEQQGILTALPPTATNPTSTARDRLKEAIKGDTASIVPALPSSSKEQPDTPSPSEPKF